MLYSTPWIVVSACPLCSKELEAKIVATAGDHVPAEIEYRCPEHGVVGYWAYGYFDPSYPLNEETI